MPYYPLIMRIYQHDSLDTVQDGSERLPGRSAGRPIIDRAADGFFQVFRVPVGGGDPEQVTSDPTTQDPTRLVPVGRPDRLHRLQLPGALLADSSVLAQALTAADARRRRRRIASQDGRGSRGTLSGLASSTWLQTLRPTASASRMNAFLVHAEDCVVAHDEPTVHHDGLDVARVSAVHQRRDDSSRRHEVSPQACPPRGGRPSSRLPACRDRRPG